MAETTNLKLYTEDGGSVTFQEWRKKVAGETNSNMTKLDEAVAGKQDKFSPDGTLTLKDGVLGVSFPNRAITRAEYDALSEEEKMAQVNYIITDDDSESSAPFENVAKLNEVNTFTKQQQISGGQGIAFMNGGHAGTTLYNMSDGFHIANELGQVRFCDSMGGMKAQLKDLEAPTEAGDAATKEYVDQTVAEAGSGPYYATCSTAANEGTKTAVCDGFTLKTGAAVAVKFTYTNTVSSPALNVNDTGAKPIKRYGGAANMSGRWPAGAVVLFVYDGESYMMVTAQTGDFYANVDVHNNFITGLKAPVSPSDAVNLQTLMSMVSNCVDTLTVSLTGPSGNASKTLSVPVLDRTAVGKEVAFYLDATIENAAASSGFNKITVLYPAGVVGPMGDWSEADWLSFTLNNVNYALYPSSTYDGWTASFPLTTVINAGRLVGYLRCRYGV